MINLHINIKKHILFFVLIMPILAQQFNAHKFASLGLSLVFYMFFLYFIIMVLVKFDKDRIFFLLTSPIIVVILLFIFIQFITIFTANNNIELIRMALMPYLNKIFILFPTFLFGFRIHDFLRFKSYIFLVFWILLFFVLIEQIDIVNQMISGVYYQIQSDRFGWQPIHSFMPISNSFAPYLFFFLIVTVYIYNNKAFTYIIYLLSIFSSNRMSILIFSLAIFKVMTKAKKIFFVLLISFLIFLLSLQLNKILQEVSFTDEDKVNMVPRLHYIVKSFELFSDYTWFGIGLRRYSNQVFWIQENYYWQNKYGIQTDFIDEVGYKMEMAVTDTGLIFLAEIGIVGSILIALLFAYLFYIGKVVHNEILKIYILAGLVYLYNITDPFNTYVFGIAFWFIVGVFLNEYYLIKRNKGYE